MKLPQTYNHKISHETKIAEKRERGREKGPVPVAHEERVGLAVCTGGEVVDPPLGEPRSGLHSVAAITHPREHEGRRNLIEAVEDPVQQLSGLPQVCYGLH